MYTMSNFKICRLQERKVPGSTPVNVEQESESVQILFKTRQLKIETKRLGDVYPIFSCRITLSLFVSISVCEPVFVIRRGTVICMHYPLLILIRLNLNSPLKARSSKDLLCDLTGSDCRILHQVFLCHI